MYNQCATNCLVAYEDPVGAGRKACVLQCANQVCRTEALDDATEAVDTAPTLPPLITVDVAPELLPFEESSQQSQTYQLPSKDYFPQAQKAALGLFPDLMGNGEAEAGDNALNAALLMAPLGQTWTDPKTDMAFGVSG